jgi:hypothetical protein
MEHLLGKSWPTRIFTSVLGMLSVAWAIFSIPFYRIEAPLGDSVQYILLGDSFNTKQLSSLRLQLDAAPTKQLRSLALYNVALIRLRIVENELMTGNHQIFPSDLADLETAVPAALAGTPTSSFLWLTAFWLQNRRAGNPDGGLKLLRMSYLSGPNEAWIAARRNPLALSIFLSLPNEISERVLAEFAGLVRSGLYLDAANILAGPGWVFHEKLLGQLVEVNEADRRNFARALARKNLDDALVPGIGDRPARPF